MDFMKIFDVVLLAYGLYTIYCGFHMRKTKEPSSWLVGVSEISEQSDTAAFADKIFWPTVGLGIMCLLYGAVGGVNDFIMDLGIATQIVMALFLLVVVMFSLYLRKMKTEFLK